MSEQINKVLASTAQAFSTAEQKQARDNIDAQQSITFNYSGSSITALNGSAIAQSGALTFVTHDGNLTGSGTSASPLGLANPSIISGNSHSSYRADNFVMVSASGGDRSYLNEFVLEFQSAGTSFSVTPASIDLWNSYSAGRGWAESSNSLSTGYGGNQVTAASQYPDGAGNWVARTVKASGIPDSTLYGFGSKASNANGSLVGSNGQWLAYHPGYSAVYLTGTATTYDSSYLPTGVTWPMRVDVWNLGDGNDKNIKTDTFHGATSDLHYGDSATIWYVPSLDRWTDMVNI